MGENLRITLKKGHAGRPEKLRKVLDGLGLNKINKSVIRKDTPEIRGMINKVSFMVAVDAE